MKCNPRFPHIDPIIPERLKFLPYVSFFKDFQYKTFRYFLCLQIAPSQSILELEKYSFFQGAVPWDLIYVQCVDPLCPPPPPSKKCMENISVLPGYRPPGLKGLILPTILGSMQVLYKHVRGGWGV